MAATSAPVNFARILDGTCNTSTRHSGSVYVLFRDGSIKSINSTLSPAT